MHSCLVELGAYIFAGAVIYRSIHKQNVFCFFFVVVAVFVNTDSVCISGMVIYRCSNSRNYKKQKQTRGKRRIYFKVFILETYFKPV